MKNKLFKICSIDKLLWETVVSLGCFGLLLQMLDHKADDMYKKLYLVVHKMTIIPSNAKNNYSPNL